MLRRSIGIVVKTEALDSSTQLLHVDVDGDCAKAIAYTQLSGAFSEGEQVLINITATELNLGTGGYDFAITNLTHPSASSSLDKAHIMKLRYTPFQHSVLTEEEQQHPSDESLTLNKLPVVAAGLHSQIALIASGIKARAPESRVVYIMTDAAALPLAFSNLVRTLVSNGLIDETITCGQAFGGQREAVNLYSALAVAQSRARADVVIVCQGPGNVGTDTALGYSGIEVGQIINAVHSLGGRPICCLRMSEADQRARHRLVSHHSLTVLAKIALAAAFVPVPLLEDALTDEVHQQFAALKLFESHEIGSFDGQPGVDLLHSKGIDVQSMGRTFKDDPVFFLAASAAGRAAADMLRLDFWG